MGYVLSAGDMQRFSGPDTSLLIQALMEPGNIILIAGTLVLFFVAFYFLKKNALFMHEMVAVKEKAQAYRELIPWIIRLSLGIMLIGAGTANTLISPVAIGFPQYSLIQILLGFFLLSGFLLAPTIVVTSLLYMLAWSQHVYLVGSLEVLALCAAFFLLSNPRPGVDDLFNLWFLQPSWKWQQYAPLALRIGIGIGMIYLALYEKILNPKLAELVVENFSLTSFVPVTPAMWVLGTGLIEFFIGLMLLIGFETRLSSAVAFLVLSLSFFLFKESVSAHVTLFGTLSILFITGGGPWSVDHELYATYDTCHLLGNEACATANSNI